MVSYLAFFIKGWKIIVYTLLGIILAFNLFGIETVFSFLIPDISIPLEKEGELNFIIDENILKLTLAAVVLEALDNLVSLKMPLSIVGKNNK
ncbi:hypothetical protein [Lysinibacillus sphaericus]|uniref:hypothetical protein n=1 Tax=Lysinibacillus sphaericus TaxID=1421 RepID=UPI0018CCEBFB|nr:hypothetical protein [Lysinibacillus sphaericus]MBG9692711.1 hypothetical protein [Lysinibacillus sphaericus]MEB7455144.1 hypothetical protein [Lysinibacillus sphaericus]